MSKMTKIFEVAFFGYISSTRTLVAARDENEAIAKFVKKYGKSDRKIWVEEMEVLA